MIKTINVEPIKFREKYLSTPLLTKAEVEKAMDYVVAQTRSNMEYFGTKFPWSATKGLKYPIIENIEWTDGFWTGLLWLCYEYTGDEAFRIRAEENIDSFLHRVENRIELDHHDLGFLYSISCVAGYKLTGSEKGKRAGILAADKLMERYNERDKFIQAWGAVGAKDNYAATVYDLLYYNADYYESEAPEALDAFYTSQAVTTMRSDFTDPNGSFLGFKGGLNGAAHGDIDIGSFVFDLFGERWAFDFGKENYNLVGYWEIAPGGTRWNYYRKSALGHNTLIINPTTGANQTVGAYAGKAEQSINNPGGGYTILDMTDAYIDNAVSVQRGFAYFDRTQVLIRDEYTLNAVGEIYWQMHTRADVAISEDGKTATLSMNGKKLLVKLFDENSDLRFQTMAAKPYDAELTEEENTNEGVTKLYIKAESVQTGALNVLLTPEGCEDPEIKALERWYEYDFSGEPEEPALKNGPDADGYFYINDEMQRAYQMVEYNGDYYFINDYNKIAKNVTLYLQAKWVEKYELKEGLYEFGADGKLVRNGKVTGVDGDYLYIDGILQRKYQMVKIGDDFYFINDYDKVAKNITLYLQAKWVEQFGLKEGLYEFGADGKLKRNGKVTGVDGDYLYIDGILQRRYQLVEIDGFYYFINDYDKVAKDTVLYLQPKWTDKYNLTEGLYWFDADGVMTDRSGNPITG